MIQSSCYCVAPCHSNVNDQFIDLPHIWITRKYYTNTHTHTRITINPSLRRIQLILTLTPSPVGWRRWMEFVLEVVCYPSIWKQSNEKLSKIKSKHTLCRSLKRCTQRDIILWKGVKSTNVKMLEVYLQILVKI